MSEAQHSYSDAMIAPLQIAAGVTFGVGVGVVLALLGLWPLGVAGLLVLVAVSVYLGTVTIVVSPREVQVGQGRGRRGVRDILTRNIASCEAADFGWADALGRDSSAEEISKTYVVRAGPGLRLRLTDGEVLDVSTRDPGAATEVLRAAGVRTPDPTAAGGAPPQ